MNQAGRDKVAVVGAGLMGAQIGAEYALGGLEVALVTSAADSAARAFERARLALRHLAASGLASAETVEAAEGRLRGRHDLEEACAGVSLVVESLPEDMDLKASLLSRVVQAAPEAPIASNTSSLSIDELGQRLGAEERTLGTHYWNPPTLMPLVEVVVGPRTDPELVARVEDLLRKAGKEPVRAPDIPGFIWNRLQLAFLREAVGLVASGQATPETIDLIMTRGLGRRWSLVGPFQAMALGGPATFAAVARRLWPRLHDDVSPDAILELPLPDAAALAALREKRDAALARLLQEDRAQPTSPTREAGKGGGGGPED